MKSAVAVFHKVSSMSGLERSSSIWRLVQRLTSRKAVSEGLTSPTSMINDHIQRQRDLYDTHSRDDSHRAESLAADRQAQQRTADKWDISDDPSDDDAAELHVDNSLVTQIIIESYRMRPWPGGEWGLTLVSRILQVTCSYSAETGLTGKQHHIMHFTRFTSSKDKSNVSEPGADDICLVEKPSGHCSLSLDAYGHDPVPFEDVCPIVKEFAAQQLDEFDSNKLKRRISME